MKNTINSIIRYINSLRKPSKRTNIRKLRKRGETLDSFTIREATAADILPLSQVHAKSWSETYSPNKQPAYQIREFQWRQSFAEKNDSWFCLVVEDRNGQFVGFAKCMKYNHSDLPDISGEINKIYLLNEYQRIGLGRRLFCEIVRRFINQGIHSMALFGIPQNPSAAFHEAMGGKRLINKKGGFDGGYAWYDLKQLASICTP